MLKERTQLNRYQLNKAIKNYHANMRRYMRMEELVESLKATASTGKYGIEAIMPKPVGGISDPVQAHVQIRASREDRIEKIKDELLMVQHLARKITGDVEQEVLYWLLEGMPVRWSGAKLNLSHTSVQRVRERVIYMIMK